MERTEQNIEMKLEHNHIKYVHKQILEGDLQILAMV